MALTLASAAELLNRHHLLREVIHGDSWTLDTDGIDGADAPFVSITYDTRQVGEGSLLVCKGRFRPEFLDGCDERGLAAYVAETDLSERTKAPGLIVDDARKALALLATEFYGRPQDELTLIGITGTKGKTTTAYFTQAILNAYSGGRCALFSSVDNCLDGHTYVESDLTTPESLDAVRMMREAVDGGMRYLIMEVSSQAYKVHRVYGFTFDVGAFLNISPDHISPIEHPTFEDYLYCKRRITANSRTLILNARADHADLIRQDAAAAGVPVRDFALLDEPATESAANPDASGADATAWPADASHDSYLMRLDGHDLGRYRLHLVGDFNYENALAAVSIAHAAGVPADAIETLHAMEPTRVSGRMELTRDEDSDTDVIVDYAHNYTSVRALLDFVYERWGGNGEHPYITLVAGSAGNKAYDRRREIVEAAQDRIARFVFTAEDTDTEPYEDICRDMRSFVTNDRVATTTIIDRVAAITNALDEARAHPRRHDVVLVIGKGHERWIKDLNKHVPYEGDDQVVARLLGA
ncbi:UDP-N-acetylmuramoylalanyl-D-glutamate--2,6-diaminopimelate ligase [Bifidobacterium sp. UTCIF-37]|uniref:UDP-N-acetylmuramoyl-L-alanyl-D-glutamate--2, 6-diaminopimelate ligase n=1 Tax=unclassified Bifidobacterium TaxID=2608897 RepID=UPI001127107E|nr:MULTISPECIES: UDP-N-acetylmuramoyl-L-alanyl-D-glutamate--2,6-diaminopimelate ligase [unclassified Bifidobacterium]TPF87382.1 UDP-N-acetylmuramoylalanyl-D-glutamate--2,6-diaminopimelate ligase [Bifidobacterium sp. UTCIF-37]TPF91158.1 UDP-N-acetylmuramoylalanyl-D-glutamate--2,6-diaminopimelate ligase [Bifidobacterium sp. UTCIF-38]